MRPLGTTKKIALLLMGTALIALFQNCSKGFKPVEADTLASVAPMAAPQLSIGHGVPELTNIRNHTVTILVKYDKRVTMKTITCKLNSQAATDCKSLSLPLIALVDGSYTLKINAEDSEGQKAQEVVSNFVVDGTAPFVSVTSAPTNPTTSTTAQFVFTATDELSGMEALECSLDSGVYEACTSPKDYSGLAVGDHRVKIRAKDKATNTNAQYTHNWTIN